jgi:hypothetical protein
MLVYKLFLINLYIYIFLKTPKNTTVQLAGLLMRWNATSLATIFFILALKRIR